MLLAATMTGLAVWLIMCRPALQRIPGAGLLAGPESSADLTDDSAGPTGDRRRLRDHLLTSPWLAAGSVALLCLLFVSGWTGPPAAAVAATAAHRWVAGLESMAERRRREALNRALPGAVDLLVAALAAGRAPAQSLDLVADAVGPPLGPELTAITARLHLGADPSTVWREVARDPALAPLGRSFARATRSGASVTAVLTRCVEDLRRERRTEAQRDARSVGVRTAAPLGLCFLPAFVVIGIVPTVIGVFRELVL